MAAEAMAAEVTMAAMAAEAMAAAVIIAVTVAEAMAAAVIIAVTAVVIIAVTAVVIIAVTAVVIIAVTAVVDQNLVFLIVINPLAQKVGKIEVMEILRKTLNLKVEEVEEKEEFLAMAIP